ncbi:hypothetical protein JTB14_004011 [Gonioctena quinquepunctata]|nr:hypothetical protein JTB14_004011 [Gonioctena quinquepunctata]
MNNSWRITKLYCRLMRDNYVLVQAIQTGTLMSTGDLIAQTIIEKKPLKEVRWRRTANFFAIGTVVVGPALSVWYRTLSKLIGHTGKSVVLKKVAVDQLVFAPTFLFVFITLINTLDGHNWKHIKEELNLKYVDILLTNYTVWPAVQLFNFYFIPLRHQVLLAQSVAILWNVYISFKTQQGQNSK